MISNAGTSTTSSLGRPQSEWGAVRGRHVASGRLLVGTGRHPVGPQSRIWLAHFSWAVDCRWDQLSTFWVNSMERSALHKLDSATGKTDLVAEIGQSLGAFAALHAVRRLAGGNPSSAAGLLICPTTGGVVTAFDPAVRTLAWEYRYKVNRFGEPRSWADSPLDTGSDGGSARWLDSAPPHCGGEQSCWTTPRLRRGFCIVSILPTVLCGGSSPAAIDSSWLECPRGWCISLEDRRSKGHVSKTAARLWPRPIGDTLPLSVSAAIATASFIICHSRRGTSATIDIRRGRILTRTHFEPGLKPGNLV